MNKKIFTTLLACSIIGTVVFLAFTQNDERPRVKISEYQETPKPNDTNRVQASQDVKVQQKSISFTQAEANTINNWMKKQGYMTFISTDGKVISSGNQGYLHYDKNVLLKMAKNGDSIAAYTLGEQFISEHNLENQKSNKEVTEVENALLEATARGLTTSIDQLIHIKTQNYINSWDRKQRKFDNSYIIDAYAYLNILKLRRGFDTDMREYSLNMTRKLNAAEYALAINRSEEIYASLSQQRAKLGLGPFENNNSSETQALLQRMFNAIDNGEIQ